MIAASLAAWLGLGCATTTAPASSVQAPALTSERGAAELRRMPEPDTIWIRDAWSGLGPSYELWMRLMRVGASYEGDCALTVHPMARETLTLPPRAEARSVAVPAALVRRFVEALRRAAPVNESPGVIHLAGIDDSSEVGLILFDRTRSQPVYLKAENVNRFSIDLGASYRLDDAGEAFQAYREIVNAVGLYSWVESVNRAAQNDVP